MEQKKVKKISENQTLNFEFHLILFISLSKKKNLRLFINQFGLIERVERERSN